MPLSLEILEAEVLRLSAVERSRLLDRLIASLDADAEVEAEWDAVADSREAELDSGASKSVPFEEVIARLEARFPGRGSRSIPERRTTSSKLPPSTNEKALRRWRQGLSRSSSACRTCYLRIQVSALPDRAGDGRSR
jgi:putative addiction module component (TIGR02574 family)